MALIGDLPPRSNLAYAIGVAVATIRKVTPEPVLSAGAATGDWAGALDKWRSVGRSGPGKGCVGVGPGCDTAL